MNMEKMTEIIDTTQKHLAFYHLALTESRDDRARMVAIMINGFERIVANMDGPPARALSALIKQWRELENFHDENSTTQLLILKQGDDELIRLMHLFVQRRMELDMIVKEAQKN